MKFLLLGSSPDFLESELGRLRSLNIEHVSPAELTRREISRRSSLGFQAERTTAQGLPLADETVLALLRRWFWGRKPDAGFALTGFPATLLQAKVFDEWLDARDEALDGVIVEASTLKAPTFSPVAEHYRTLGLLVETAELAAA